jgi:hypothetical protein
MSTKYMVSGPGMSLENQVVVVEVVDVAVVAIDTTPGIRNTSKKKII